MDNLNSIGRAILEYEAANGCLPPPHTVDQNGRPLASWRAMILPYLECNDIYSRYRFAEPWDGPNNGKLAHLDLRVFRCPSDPGFPRGCTSYLAVVGPGTVWSTREPVCLDEIDDPSGTILLVEVAGSDVALLEPRDLTLDEALRGINPVAGGGISSRHPGTVTVLFADGHIETLREQMSQEKLLNLLTFEKKDPAERCSNGEDALRDARNISHLAPP